ncbi:hypothetical protein CROQUDRAFT_80351 [Cronartium quercuum f. sp. fusiforme G11]|uniref:protein-tyrosine-phosphatase n=1 Tax=Cronartium quercuum f. sp. fusiforme G11 TaxID=708437 RepID=A0A9P6TAY2_9BASI|nr:hypothetical protein CROQUDRAFT_80351 [Cronartium quercuum f. sp. fusiforme G11]
MSDPPHPLSPSPITAPIASTSRLVHPPTPIGPICAFGPRLAFTYFSNPIPDPNKLNAIPSTDTYWFTIDNLLVYLSFFQDTGPLNCACLYRFCLHLHGLLEDASLVGRRIMMYSSEDADKRANAALLISLYCMIVLRWSPADALHPISQLQIQPFRDAGYSRADFQLSIQNVLFGVKRAIDLRLLKLDEFDLKEYETFEKVENGDYNWLSPHFIAFASPVEPAGGRVGKSFKMILDQFEKVGVRLVVRLNKKLYDETRFLERGIGHKEMYFDDGTNPPMEMVREFITMCDRIIETGGVVAVHCKAGLGRTGTLIGAFLIYKYAFTAEEAIGFMRIMRPGTCVGPQQHFLYEHQMTWVKWAARDELLAEQQATISPSKTERPITPPPEHPPPTHTPAPSSSRPAATVPGQPRKTPGAKLRHMVTAPDAPEPAVGTTIDDCEMDIAPAPPPSPIKYALSTATATTSKASSNAPPIKSSTSTKSTSIVSAAVLPKPASTRSSSTIPPTLTKPSSLTKPSAVTKPIQTSRPKPRPASALSDHRPTAGPDLRRSKAVKDLGTLFEGLAKQQEPTRYNLRGGSRAPDNNNSSSSKIPQRIPGKRRGGLGVSKDEQGKESMVVGVGRSVRRRRSSLGVTDVLA